MAKFLKIFLTALGILALIFVGAYIYIFYAGGIERFVVSKIDTSVGEKYNLKISIGEIEGDLLSGVVLRNVIITYNDSLKEFNLAEIPRLEAHYSLSGLIGRKYDFSLVEIDSARFNLIAKDSGGWYLPRLVGGSADGVGALAGISGSISHFQINSASFTMFGVKDTISFSDVNSAASLEVDGETYAADLERLSFNSNRENLQLDHCSGRITYTSGMISFQDGSIGRSVSRVKFSGQYDSKHSMGNVNLTADNLDMNEISRYGGLNLHGHLDLNGSFELDSVGIRGSLDLAGNLEIMEFRNLHTDLRFIDKHLYLDTIYGTVLDKCALDGMGKIDFSGETEKYELRSSVTGFNLNGLIKNSFESELNGDIYLRGTSLRTKQMVLEVDAAFYESIFDDYHLHSAIGSMQITADSIIFYDPFIIKYFENIFEFHGGIEYKDRINIELTAQLNNLERYKGKLFIDKPAGRGYVRAKLTGKTSEPDLNFYFESDSVWIYGLYSNNFTAEADIDKFLTRKLGLVTVKMQNGSGWDVPIDSGRASLAVDSNLIWINSLELNNEFSSVNSKGIFDYESAPMLLELDTLHLVLFGQEFYNRGKIKVGVDSAGFDFQKATLGDKGVLLSGIGQVGFNEAMQLHLKLENVIISPWAKLFEFGQEYDGSISGQAELGGNLSNPEFDISLSVDSLKFRNVVLGNLAANLSYRNQQLNADSLILLSEQGRYSAVGTVPIDLGFNATTVRRLLDNPMNISVSAYDKRFDLVTTLLPSIEHLEGDFAADFRVFGSPDDPHVEGMAYLKNGKLKYFDLEQLIYADSAGVLMQDNKVIIDNIEAYGFKGNKLGTTKKLVQIEGEIVIKALDNLYYDVYVTLPREFPFTYELADIRGSIEGELHVEGETPPLVSGNLSLVAMRYGVNFATPDEGSPIMEAFSEKSTWDLNLNIDILSNYWIKNDNIDAQFTGFINFIRKDGRYSFIGEIEVIRGRGYFFDKSFTLEPGGLVTFEGGDSLNPRLDLTGYTRITSYVPPVFPDPPTSVQRNLGIHITGTLDYPEIKPTENSEIPADEIVQVLAGSSYYSSETSSFGTIEQRASVIVATQVSQIGSKQLSKLGVETFEIDPGFYQGGFDIASIKFTVGFYTPFDPNLYLYGRSAIGSSTGQELGFEYRLNKTFLLEGRRDEEELHSVNLKLHWEF